jgi:uncharacterized protein YjaZ
MKLKFIAIILILTSNFVFGQYGNLVTEGQIGKVVYKVYSQRNHFEEFLKGMTNDTVANYNIWEKSIYNKTKAYWDIDLKKEKDIKFAKNELFEFHSKIKENSNVLGVTKLFENEIEKYLIKTFTYYNSEKDTISVILVPIDSQGGTVKGISERNGIMPIGVNLIQTTRVLKGLVPHEYTHRYNGLKGGLPIDDKTWEEKSKMFWSLWGEGLASYGTGVIMGDFSIYNVMLRKEYETFAIDKRTESWLAKQFLKQYDAPLLNTEDDTQRAKWFASNSTDIRKDFPPAIGYYLGFLVVRYSIDKLGYTFEELLSMKPNELKKIGEKALMELGKTTTNRADRPTK